MRRVSQVRKRDGRVVPFERTKIADAILRAARRAGTEDRFLAEELAGVVVLDLEQCGQQVVRTHDVQAAVERILLEAGHADTAKAYVHHAERRAQARQARQGVVPGSAVLIVGERGEEAAAWSKGVIVEALLEVDGVERVEAEEIARAVDRRVLASVSPRVSWRTVRALVEAEMFDRGRESRLGREPVVGLPLRRLARWLLESPADRRPADPDAFARLVGEEVLAEYVLSEVVGGPVSEAHRLGDLHLLDLGAPLAFTSLALPVGRLLEAHLRGDEVTRAGGPRRMAAAIADILDRYRPFTARVVGVEALNVHLAPYVSHLTDEDALAGEIRELLLSPALSAFPGRGGLLDLEIGLCAEMPARLARREVPPPAPPGCPYGAYGDTAFEVARVILHEATRLRRRGWESGPRFTLTVPRGGPRDAAARALLHQALASAAEVGEPLVVFEDPGVELRGTRWYRLREAEALDPLRFADGDVSASTACALNLVGAALRAGRGAFEAFLGELDRLVRLAMDGALARRNLLERCGEDPGQTLYPLRRGPAPLVDLEGACHLIEPVGLARAAALLEPAADASWQAGFQGRIWERIQERTAAESAARGLTAAVVAGLGTEAPGRFARQDAARYPEAASWWLEGQAPSYAAPPPPPGEPSREATFMDRLRVARAFLRIRHRIEVDQCPEVGDLLTALERASHDSSVVEYALEPWPRRVLRATGEAKRR